MRFGFPGAVQPLTLPVCGDVPLMVSVTWGHPGGAQQWNSSADHDLSVQHLCKGTDREAALTWVVLLRKEDPRL